MTERQTKLQRIDRFLKTHGLGAVLLWHRNNFAWMSGGCDNHIGRASPAGVAGLLVTGGKVVCITNTIESPRFRDEELIDTGIEVVDYPWHDAEAGRKLLGKLLGKKSCAADFDALGAGLPALPRDFAELRWQLLPEEIERYRLGGRIASEAIESACRIIEPGMTEKQIAAILDHETHTRGGHPVVTLIASDERLQRFRHPIPTMKRFERVVMLVLCSEYKGMISNLTRIVHVGAIDAKTRRTIQAVADIDTHANLVTRPGRTLGEVFSDLQKAYRDAKFPDEWKLHHQGGSTGYEGREIFATPGSSVRVLADQAFAWNPSVPGCKSEDTMLVTERGIESITAPGADWPTVTGRSPAGTLRRASWLEI